MSLQTFRVDRARETAVAGLMRRNWTRLAATSARRRLWYVTGALVCDPDGFIGPTLLAAALSDGDVVARAYVLLAVIRYEKNDGGSWSPTP